MCTERDQSTGLPAHVLFRSFFFPSLCFRMAHTRNRTMPLRSNSIYILHDTDGKAREREGEKKVGLEFVDLL